jgi:hypothetical protein
MSRANQTNKVPSLLLQMVAHLEGQNALKIEGIFRLCGHQDNITALVAEFDTGSYFPFYTLRVSRYINIITS